MPNTPLEYNIPDLDPLSNPADLVSRYLEVADASGKNNKVGFPAMVQVVADILPGGNSAKNHYKLARTYDATTPGYIAGFPTLVGLDQDFLAGGAICWVEFPSPSREYRLMFDPNGPVTAFISGEFVGQKLNYSWVEKTEADQLTASFAAFDPFKDPKYAQGDTVKFRIAGFIRLFEARQDLVKASYGNNRIPEPTGLGTDPNWNEISVQPTPNDSTGGQIACRFRFDAESQADPYGGDTLESVGRRNQYLYTNRLATVELGPHAGTYRVVYETSNPEFMAYVDGSFTSGKLPCKWALVPTSTGGGSGGTSSGTAIYAFPEKTASAAGTQVITLAQAATGMVAVYVLEASGYTRPVYPTEYSVSGNTLTVSADANVVAGDKLAGYYYAQATGGGGTPGGGGAATLPDYVTINSVTGGTGSITVNASSANTTKAIEYLHPTTSTWQTSNVLGSVSPGTYTNLQARLKTSNPPIVAVYTGSVLVA